jgi:hypothetical protein
MISAKKCRTYAAECRLIASSTDSSAQRSLEQTIMALNWTALADEIDRNSAQAASAAFFSLGGPVVPSNFTRLSHPSHRADQSAIDWGAMFDRVLGCDRVSRVFSNIAREK